MTGVDDLFATKKTEEKAEDPAVPAAADPATAVTEPTTKRRATAGKFIVLKQVGDDDSGSFMIVEESVEAPNRETAIREVAVTEEGLIEGGYVAVPLASWKVINVKQTTKIQLF